MITLHPATRKSPDRTLQKCALLCFLTALLSLGWLILMGRGAFIVCGDFNAQVIPFTEALHRALAEGRSWSFCMDLGTQTVGAFSYYGLGSPFFWITMLFPASAAPYLMGWIYILKYVIAGMTSFLYLRQFTRNPDYAVLGAILYAFSGFQAVNLIFYTFHDSVSFFPLLLLGLDRMIPDGKAKFSRAKPFIAAVALNCLTNYYFFVGEVVFLILYFCVRYWKSGITIKENLKNIGVCALAGLWGVLIASVLFIPNVLFILGNKRSHTEFLLSRIFPNPKQLLYIIKGFLLPGEPMYDTSAIYDRHWTSTSAYLPMIGMAGVIGYLRSGRRDWLTRMLYILLIMAVSPILSSAFLLFTEVLQRWFYMLILMMAAASSVMLEGAAGKSGRDAAALRSGIRVNMVLIILFYLAVRFMKWDSSDTDVLVFHKEFFLLLTLVSLAGLVFLYRLNPHGRKYLRRLTSLVLIFAFATNLYTLIWYRCGEGMTASEYMQKAHLYEQLNTIDDQYRYIDENDMMFSENASGLRTFSSTASNSLVRFDDLFDFYKQARRLDKTTYPGLAELLGGKYCIADEKDGGTPLETVRSDGRTYYIEEKNACPIGFAVSQFITTGSLRSVNLCQRAVPLLFAAVIDPADREKINSSGSADVITASDAIREIEDIAETLPEDSETRKNDDSTASDPENNAGVLPDEASSSEEKNDTREEMRTAAKKKGGQKAMVSDDALQAVVACEVDQDTAKAVKNFRRTSSGFTCVSDYSDDTWVYFSVPNDSGWTATVDGEETEIVDSCGMMLIHVPEGTHDIRFEYTTPGLAAGAALSLLSLSAFVLTALLPRRKRGKEE